MSSQNAISPLGAPDNLEVSRGDAHEYVLILYVAGATPRSLKAIENARSICDELLKGRYDLQIVDIYADPHGAKEHQVVAVPTLIKSLPLPLRRVIGDLSE